MEEAVSIKPEGRSYSLRPIAYTALAASLVLVAATILSDYAYVVLSAQVYLPLHFLMEMGSVAMSFSIFALYWKVNRDTSDARGLLIGTGFLAVALLDSMHALSFAGMPVFVTPSSTEKGIYYWLAARMWAMAVLLTAFFVKPNSRGRFLRWGPLLALNLMVAVLAFVAVSFFPAHLPRMYFASSGLTPLKIALEYVVAAAAAAGTVLYGRGYAKTGNRFLMGVAIALALTVASELCFTLYVSAYDAYNLLGHLFKIAAYYAIFSATFSSAIRRPYRELAALNDQVENQLKVTIARLEETTRAERQARERAEAAIELLRPLQTVTEAASSNEVLNLLLQDLLHGIRRVLDADTARLLLLSEDGADLIVRASSGLETINTGEIRIPMGKGVAGEIAVTGEPMLLDDVSTREVVMPLFRERVRSLIGAPLRVKGEIVGVVHVGAHTVRHFTDEDLRLLVRVAEGVSSALERARLYAQIDATVTAMPNGVMVYSPSGYIVRMNPASESILAYSPQEMALPLTERMLILKLETEDGTPLPLEMAPSVRALRGEVVQNEVVVIQRPHRARIWLSISAAPLQLDAAGVLGAVVTFSDVSVLHELQLQRSEHVLGISHGLRTPLTVIQGEAQLIRDLVGPIDQSGRSKRSADAIVGQCRRMGLVLRDLVDLTSLETGKRLMLNKESVDLAPFMKDLLLRSAGILETGRVQLLAPQDLPPVQADPDRLERIMANLLSNALKYSPAGSCVEITLSRQGPAVSIEVTDVGPGLSDEKQAVLFQRYRRRQMSGESSETLGLGLYITKGMLEAHGSELCVRSALGKGSTFGFSLPV